MHSDDVWMVNLFQSHYFSLNCFSLHTVVQFRLLIYFNSIFLLRSFIITTINHCISTLSDWFAYTVTFKSTSRWLCWITKVAGVMTSYSRIPFNWVAYFFLLWNVIRSSRFSILILIKSYSCRRHSSRCTGSLLLNW
jgi:hypothetical protein